MSYKIEPLTEKEYATLSWLAARGYDAGILDTAGVESDDNGVVTLGEIPEHKAWEIREAIEEDPHAFLACNGSETLAAKLLAFTEAIV